MVGTSPTPAGLVVKKCRWVQPPELPSPHWCDRLPRTQSVRNPGFTMSVWSSVMREACGPTLKPGSKAAAAGVRWLPGQAQSPLQRVRLHHDPTGLVALEEAHILWANSDARSSRFYTSKRLHLERVREPALAASKHHRSTQHGQGAQMRLRSRGLVRFGVVGASDSKLNSKRAGATGRRAPAL
jgi:hypothetical protein